jgi:hypothetical protein
MPLANFPKTFNITKQAKGYFPFKFNNEINKNDIGKIPPKTDYGNNLMNEDKKKNSTFFMKKK